ncbi:3-deoxy-d-arabino-heptulosonate 7-phosphatesynthase, partial [Striga asiatica]
MSRGFTAYIFQQRGSMKKLESSLENFELYLQKHEHCLSNVKTILSRDGSTFAFSSNWHCSEEFFTPSPERPPSFFISLFLPDVTLSMLGYLIGEEDTDSIGELLTSWPLALFLWEPDKIDELELAATMDNLLLRNYHDCQKSNGHHLH